MDGKKRNVDAARSRVELAGLVVFLFFYPFSAGAQSNLISFLEEPTPQKQNVVPGEVLVRFRPKVARERQHAVLRSVATEIKDFQKPGFRGQLKNVNGLQDQSSVWNDAALVRLNPRTDLSVAMEQLGRHPDVLYVEPNFRLRIADSGGSLKQNPSNDFELEKLWALHNTGQTGGTNRADIHAFEAWQIGTGSRDVIVAVVDTGIDYFHPDLAENIWKNRREIPGNGLDDDQNGYVDDEHGFDFISGDSDPLDDHNHGTHSSGIIGAVGNNKRGISGICWQVSIMALKAFDETGDGDVAGAVQAIQYAVANGAQIINASWGSGEKSRLLEEAIEEADKAGVLFVAAAGNERTESLFFPAAYKNVLAVAATDHFDRKAAFSNFGPYVDLAAPGDFIFSTIPNNQFDYASGTSMAAPFASGVAALILSRHPEFTNREIENILRNTTDSIDSDTFTGSGRLNAYKAMLVDSPLPVAELKLPEIVSGNAEIVGAATADDFVSYSLAYGKGRNPTNWVEFHQSTSPVQNGVLFGGLTTSMLEEGSYTFRLVARSSSGTSTARTMVKVRNVSVDYPVNNDILRAGQLIPIKGTVFGEGRTYTVQYGIGWRPSVWQDDGIALSASSSAGVLNGTLATWDTTKLKTNEFYTLKLTARHNEQIVGEDIVQMVYLDGHLKPGWPQYNSIVGEYPTEDWRDTKAADLDGDGLQEVIIVHHGNADGLAAKLVVYSYDGTIKWSKELGSGYPHSDIPVIGDIDRDGKLEVFADAGEPGRLLGFRHDGTPLGGNWPVRLEARNLGKVMADLDLDGFPEIIAFAQEPASISGLPYRQLIVIDRNGNVTRKWNIPACSISMDVPKMFPAVANLDQDPEVEIVVVSGCGEVSLFDLANSSGPFWSASSDGGHFVASPVIGDLDGNGTNEIVIGAAIGTGAPRGGLYIFRNDGKRAPGWPVLLEESFTSTVSLADMDGDRDLEIVAPSNISSKVHMLHHTGFSAEGWPVGPLYRSRVRSNVVIGDINNDGSLEVVMPSPGYWYLTATTGDPSYIGGLKAWNAKGRSIDLNDHRLIDSIPMEFSSGSYWFKSAPAVLTDLDGNGKLDIVASSIHDASYPLPGQQPRRKWRSSIYAWELDTPVPSPDRLPWPTFQGSVQHTGFYQLPPKPKAPPVVYQIPNQIIQRGNAFTPFYLDDYVEDLDDRLDALTWTITGSSQLLILFDGARKVVVETPDLTWTGKETVQFKAVDPTGLASSVSVIFEVREQYNPPVADPDLVGIFEDSAVEVNALANDHDPNGRVLEIETISKPRFGTAARTAQRTILYTPSQDFSGTDSFTYTISNGDGGMAIGVVNVEVANVNDAPFAEADQVITSEDVSVLIDVLGNDTDADADSLTLVQFDQPENGKVIQEPGGSLLYTPERNFSGLDSFSYKVRDAHSVESTGAAIIMIKPVDDSPVVSDRVITLNKNASATVDYIAEDPDGDSLEFELVKGPEHGALFAFPTIATYSPKRGFVGQDKLVYKASDGHSYSAEATVSFNVIDANNPPEADDQSVVTKPNQPVEIKLGARDLDEEPLSFQILTSPAAGQLSGTGSSIIYTPNPNYLGPDQFTYQASDGQARSRVATVSIRVTDENTPPIVRDLTVEVRMNSATNISLPASDPESDPLFFEFLSFPSNGEVSGSGPKVLYTPVKDFIGYDRFTFRASDLFSTSTVASVSIVVRPLNDPPNVQDQSITIAMNRTGSILLEVVDPNGDLVRCPILKGPRNGKLTGTGTSFVYTPKAGYIGPDTFTYKAWDGTAYSKEGKVQISVVPLGNGSELRFSAVRLQQGGMMLTLKAELGKSVVVEASSDLINWTPIYSATIDSSPLSVIDPDVSFFGQRYYRAVQF